MVIKMRMVQGEAFEKALVCCMMAFGCMVRRKRTLVHIVAFCAEDAEIIRDTLESVGSKYAGYYKLY